MSPDNAPNTPALTPAPQPLPQTDAEWDAVCEQALAQFEKVQRRYGSRVSIEQVLALILLGGK